MIEKLRQLVCVIVRACQDLLDCLNTDGGHILIFLILIAWLKWNPILEKHSELIIGGLLLILKAAGSNKTRRDAPSPIVEETKETTTTVSGTAANGKV